MWGCCVSSTYITIFAEQCCHPGGFQRFQKIFRNTNFRKQVSKIFFPEMMVIKYFYTFNKQVKYHRVLEKQWGSWILNVHVNI